ncbi:type II toxin-antitoxin system RelE/ParE family toxin [Polaribacter cellanae]|uniref:Type II toxin-antitoxin system RelE/ParE family toxin n=1 Tax=Polaribacter cellanae TaxID=2818493 RepID=A0A975CJL6_9FLAO|nr:type II toxin-antitoxin system RelE/ParE family toxin [Polaribacter cellanae]QTE21096.1 type II toxin-antitoxin system RelE/ParE family toxin [Polaribacter cellanae]
MSKNYEQIIWSTQSEIDLDDILEYYLEFSPNKAYIHINDIIDAVEEIVFSEQWQIDEFDPSCRRVIVKKKYRVYYQVDKTTVRVTRVYPTQKNPNNILDH